MSENQTQESSTKKANNSTQDNRPLRTWQRLPAQTEQEPQSVAGILNRAPSQLLTRRSVSWPRTAVVQTKLTVNEPDDQYEQEADRVADTVMRMPATPLAFPPPPSENQSTTSHFQTRSSFTQNLSSLDMYDSEENKRGKLLSNSSPLMRMPLSRETSESLTPTRHIQRYELEGPWHKNDPVHEVLTLRAIKEAITKINSEGKKPRGLLKGVDSSKLPDSKSEDEHNLDPANANSSLQQLIRGVVWPDDPQSYLFDDEKGTENYSSGLMWYEEFDADEKDESKELTARSHFGDLQFFHAMASKDGEKPEDTKKKIMEWAGFLTEVANGSIDPNSQVKDVPLAAELFSATEHQEMTLKALFGYPKAKDEEIHQRAAGALMHLVQDSNAEGHVGRDEESGDVTQFRSYEGQDHGEHGAKDAWAEAKTLGDRIKNTPGAENAVNKCAEILVMLDQGATTDEVLAYLDEQIFKLDPNAEASGPGADFEKDKPQVKRTTHTSLMRMPTYRDTQESITSIIHIPPLQAQLIARLHAAREEASTESPPVTPALESRIQGMNGGGSPLPDSERSFFESRMGADFSGVRIHTDNNAAQTSRDLSARAFTVGNNIAFNSGEYQPGTSAGRYLLAHELTHTIQQGGVSLKRVQREVEDEVQAPSLEEAVSQAQAEVSESEVASQEVEPIEGEEVELGAMDEVASEGGEGVADVSVAAEAAPAPAESEVSEAVSEPAAEIEGAEALEAPEAEASVEGVLDPSAPESKEMPLSEGAPAAAVDEMTKGEAQEGESSSTASEATPEATMAESGEESPTSGLAQEKEASSSAPPAEATDSGTSPDQMAPEERATSDESVPEERATPSVRVPEERATVSEQPEMAIEQERDQEGEASSEDTASASQLIEEEPIQRSLGSIVIQRKVAPTSAEDDPAFQNVVMGVQGIAAQQKEHPPAQQKADEVAAAAQMPPQEQLGKAQDQQTSEIAAEANAQEAKAAGGSAPGFDKGAFVASVKAKIDALTPQDPKKMENIEGSGVFDNAKGVVDEKVQAGKEQAQGQVDDKTEEAPDTGSVPDKPVTPLQLNDPGSLPAGVDASGAAPKAKDASEFETPLQAESQALDEQLAAANITEEQLEKSNEPEFQNSLVAKKEAQTAVQTDLPAYRSSEQGIISQSQAEAQTVQDGGLETLAGSRAQIYGGMDDLQSVGKQEDEAKRTEIGLAIDGIYQSTKSDVEAILKEMEEKVQSAFNGGAEKAKTAATDYIKKETDAYKQKRYEGIGGKLTWVGDKFTGMPDEYYDFYRQGRDLYIQEMEVVLNDVADIVGSHLGRAKQRIEAGKQQITEYVASQPEELRQVAGEVAENTLAKFSELEQNVDNKQQEMVDSLAQQYNQQLSALDSELEAMKEQDKGLLDKAKDAVTGTINTILELKAMLESALANAAGAIELIIQDPIGFLSNLLEAVKQGLGNFVANIGTHLKAGLIQWLTGAVAATGLQMPAEFDLKGIFSLVMQILGLTYANIRAQVVKALGPMGEEIVGALEQTWEIFQIIATEGIAGLWQFIQDQIGDLKAMVMDQIEDMLITQVIKAGIQWLIGVLGGPAGAFIKAVQAIISVVTWFMDNASRIASLINSIFGSLAAIAQGSIGAAASLIENSLAQTLPMVISFLADLLGLGGIADKVKEIFNKVREPINKAIQWIVQKALAMGKKIMKMLGLGKKDEEGKEGEFTQQEREAGLSAIDTEEQAFLQEEAITRQDAEKVVGNVKAKHPVFESLTVVDGKDSWDYEYVFRARKEGEKKRRTPEEDLEAAKEHFGSKSFKSGELLEFLISRGVSKTTAKRRIRQWKDENVLFAYQSEAGERDTNKELSFDESSLPQEVRPVATGNRETYGYTNPRHTSSAGFAIIRKGLIIEKDPSSPTGYKYNYAPGKENDVTYLQTDAHFRCARSEEIFQWRGSNLHLGHHEGMGASDHWNQTGHTQTQAENQAWNNDPANYQGPEMAEHSKASGGSSARYEPPSPEKGSHPMWWNPNDPNYAGN